LFGKCECGWVGGSPCWRQASGLRQWLQLTPQAEDSRPNFVLILVDDAALMDFGAYGGEARTPNIDALAARGEMFRRHYSSPLCSPSRAMLLTGMDNHMTGIATIPEVLPKDMSVSPATRCILNRAS
jgi:arylsulfatase A-like enzyme